MKFLLCVTSNFLNQIGMAREIDLPMRETNLDHIAEFARTLAEEIEARLAKVGQISRQTMPLRPHRDPPLRHVAIAPFVCSCNVMV